jgi:ADP-ribosylglycohydrolase
MADGRVRARRAPAFDEVPWARPMPEVHRWRGMFLGLAIGDALGNTSESMTSKDHRAPIRRTSHYLPNRYADQRQVGLPSDDTQLCAWAAEQIIRDGAFSPEAWLAMVSSRTIFVMGRSGAR